ncbi:MAG: gliding motility-associated C-terminal domain-containing protein [Bacteroidia bacterium]|nr:gliding motility-associated C-terminal domain-containing protein [Bacteroidia bacterium]
MWSVTVTDGLTGCQINDVFFIQQPPALTLNIVASSPTACVGNTIGLTGNTSGGTAGYTYTWTSGPISNSMVTFSGIAGTYTFELNSRDTNNCSVSNTTSIAFINNPVLSINNVSICPLETATLTVMGATTYSWSNAVFTNSIAVSPTVNTQYTVTGNAMGCTNTAVGSVVIKSVPVVVFSSNSPVCNGQVLSLSAQGGTAYVWVGPQSFTSNVAALSFANAGLNHNGIYTTTVTAANSCTNTAAFTLSVHPTPALSASGGTLCVTQTLNLSASSFAGSTFFWTGPGGFTSNQQNPSVINPAASASGVYTVKATSAVGCTNTALANVTITPLPQNLPGNNSPKCLGDAIILTSNNSNPGTSYSWNGPNAFLSSLSNNTISNVNLAAGGVYTLYISFGPCTLSNTTTVIINPLPSPTATSNGPVCELKKLNLSLSAPGSTLITYNWQGPLGFGSNSASPSRDSVSLAFSGVYSVTVVDINSCQASTTLSVSILKNPVLSTTSATVCLRDSAILVASGANSYFWFGKNGYVSGSYKAFIASASNSVGAPEQYTVQGTAANGCTAIATASVVTLKLPDAGVVVSPAKRQCLNSEFVFTGTGGNYYHWQGPGNINFNGSPVTVKATNVSFAGGYSLTVYDTFGCHSGTSTAISIDPLPEAQIISNSFSACVPFCGSYTLNANKNTPLVNHLMSIGGKSDTSTVISKCYTSAGIYTLNATIVDSRGCANQLNYLINVYQKPNASFNYLPLAPIENSEINFYDQSEGERLYKFDWYFANNVDYKAHGKNTSYIFEEAGNYAVALLVENEMGCSDSIVKTIRVEQDYNFFVPNVFTPNGDGKNDLFVPVSRGVKQYTFRVFNRWGQLIYDGIDKNLGWNGIYNGRDCPEDVYVWKASVLTKAGDIKEYSGHVTLYR